jgi:hypothetical protein
LNRFPSAKVLTLSLLSCTFLTATAVSLDAQQADPAKASTDSREAPLPDAPAPRWHPAAAGTLASAADDPALNAPLTFHERLKIYAQSFTAPENFIGPALGAGIGQWRDSPAEWGQGADGFAKRYASGFGRSVIARTISFGLAAADGEDSRYFRSHESGIWRRTRHATVSTFVSRGRNGGRVPAISRFVGVYSAGFIANAWEPPSQRDSGHAIERGSTALLSGVGWRLFDEFWPDIRHAIHWKSR